MGKSDRETRKTTPQSINEIPTMGRWGLQRDSLLPLIGRGCSLHLQPLLKLSCGHRMPSGKEVQVLEVGYHAHVSDLFMEDAGDFQVTKRMWMGY